ncbi:sigma-54-dependent Fis family transcriptional regulator [Oceanobacillus sp. Castelsardo]|uniref:sigma-54-dependent Fis family transcriptional regulator n=1 Tax=Oceanobacillus sp. Castelsardo TaxID=1851204 RepID=UPI0008385EA3|nr:sigma-54-dependent transcriptional regulator [Oceanobacillus sp. Castelsardo]
MIKALFIAPYTGLAETVKKTDIPDDFDIDIEIANLEDAIDIAERAEKDGYDLIISRGGTASMIEEVVSIPVIHVDISGYDMLRVFTFIREMNDGVALVGFENITRSAETLFNIMEYDVRMVTVKSRDDVTPTLEKLKNEGFTVVLGDTITIQEAEKIGLRGILITSGKEAIMDAYDEARRLYRLFKGVTRQVNEYHHILHSLPFPFVFVNNEKEILEKNSLFHNELLQHDVIIPDVWKVVKRVLESGQSEWAEIDRESKGYVIQVFPVEEKKMAGMIVHSSFPKLDNKSYQINHSPVRLPIIGDSRQAEGLRNHLNKFALTDDSILIIGEAGTGKSTVAQAIHFERFGQDYPIVSLGGSRLNDLNWEELNRTLYKIQKGTLLFKNIEELSKQTQHELLELLHQKPNEIKVITLVSHSLDSEVQKGQFHKELYNKLSNLPLHLTPLRERKEDIATFVHYFLSDFHAESGNETLGMKKEAMDYLKQFDWPGNFNQLKNVINELSLTTSDFYIELNHVKEVLSHLETGDTFEETVLHNRTLKEIEQEIIKKVLEEENHNQTKAAKRLGINRTTLWRKLNQ